jgi:DNA-binding beta-propeller fold protein YncE
MKSLALFILATALGSAAVAQNPDQLDYTVDGDFFHLPEGWNFGPTPGAARTPDGNILIFTRGPHALLEFTSEGAFVRELAHGQFDTPHGLRVDREGNIWTTDIVHQLVIKFDRDGRKQMVLGIRGNAGFEIDTLGLQAKLFDKPTDVAFDSEGNVYVSDGYGNSRVVKYTADGEYVSEWGEHGSEPGQFNLPHTIYVDPDNRVWVGDRNNHRIQIFDTEGALLEVLDHVGYPWGLSPSLDGNVWMADGTANRIVKLSHEGEILGAFGEPGRTTGKLGWVHYLTELPDGSVIVAEIVSHRASRYVMK